GFPGEVAEMLLPVTEGHGLVVPAGHVADETARAIFHHHADGDFDRRVGRRAPGGGEVVEDVAFISHATVECGTGTATARGTSNPHGEHIAHCHARHPTTPDDTSPTPPRPTRTPRELVRFRHPMRAATGRG